MRPALGGIDSVSPFIGRVTEMSDIERLVSDHRLVTLVGPGGVGKTRLALRALDRGHTSQADLWCVSLAELTDARSLLYDLASAVGLPELPTDLGIGAIVVHLGTAPGLLFLDNCEHLVDACAEIVATLVAGCPGLHVLTTSRQPLRVAGEHVYDVLPLTPAESAELFEQRAIAALPTWSPGTPGRAAVATLCAAVDHLPLAVELLATQVRTYDVDTLAQRFVARGGTRAHHRGVPERQRSLHACMQWSYDLCTGLEQLLWRRMAVFAGSFSLEAAEYAGRRAGLSEADIDAAVSGLVEKSIITRDSASPGCRYVMLEVVRQFAGSLDATSGDVEDGLDLHLAYYVELAQRFAADWHGPRQRDWMRLLEAERGNLRMAFQHAVGDESRAPAAMRMASVCEHFFAATGSGGEALTWLTQAVAFRSGTDQERASTYRIICFVANLVNELDTAGATYDRLVALAETTDDERILAQMLYAGCVVRTWQNDVDEGARLGAEGIELLHKLGDEAGLETNLHFLRGMVLGWAGRVSESSVNYQTCLELALADGERWLSSYAMWGLGLDALAAGDIERAVDLERTALEAKADFGDQLGIGLTIEVLAWASGARAEGRRAAVLLGAATAIWDRIGMSIAAMPYVSRMREDGVAAVRAQLGAGEFNRWHRWGHSATQARVIAIALGHGALPGEDAQRLLTRREREIAALLAAGATNKAIAETLVISARTVESHVAHILQKLGVDTRAHVAEALGVVSDPSDPMVSGANQ